MDDPDPEGAHDADRLALAADRLREIDDLLGDDQPFLSYLVRMAYVAVLESLGAAAKR